MKRLLFLSLIASALAVGLADTASALERTVMGAIAYRRAQCQPWHGGYSYTPWGAPTALVVPPNVETQTHWGWGVGSTRITTIRHQFEPNWPGPGSYDARMYRTTPPRPANTDQFGVYYIRGPW